MIIEKLATLALLASTKTGTVLAFAVSGIAFPTSKAKRPRTMGAGRRLIHRSLANEQAITIPESRLTLEDQWARLSATSSHCDGLTTLLQGQQRDAESAVQDAALALQALQADLAGIDRLRPNF